MNKGQRKEQMKGREGIKTEEGRRKGGEMKEEKDSETNGGMK